jgi:hypothetical protein
LTDYIQTDLLIALIQKIYLGLEFRTDMQQVEIRIKGEIDENWSSWFSGFDIEHKPQGESILVGSVRDQAELRGILSKLADLSVELISVNVKSTNKTRIF